MSVLVTVLSPGPPGAQAPVPVLELFQRVEPSWADGAAKRPETSHGQTGRAKVTAGAGIAPIHRQGKSAPNLAGTFPSPPEIVCEVKALCAA